MSDKKEMVKALRDWRDRLRRENSASESEDFWNEEEYEDETMFKAILSALEKLEKLEKKEPLYMHNWLEADAVKLDIDTEQIIQELADNNREMELEINRLRAALEGPSEEERKGHLNCLESGCKNCNLRDLLKNRGKCLRREAIRALILGDPVPGKEEK